MCTVTHFNQGVSFCEIQLSLSVFHTLYICSRVAYSNNDTPQAMWTIFMIPYHAELVWHPIKYCFLLENITVSKVLISLLSTPIAHPELTLSVLCCSHGCRWCPAADCGHCGHPGGPDTGAAGLLCPRYQLLSLLKQGKRCLQLMVLLWPLHYQKDTTPKISIVIRISLYNRNITTCICIMTASPPVVHYTLLSC